MKKKSKIYKITYSLVFRTIFYPAYNKLIGRNGFSVASDRIKTQYLDAKSIEDIQLEKLKTVLINAYENVPFYKRRFNEIGFNPRKMASLDDFNKLDFFVTKNEIRENTEEFISVNCDRKKLNWHRTGGSTGTPLLFATDRLTDSASASAIIRALSWWGIKLGEKHAMFWGSPTFIVRTPLDHLKKNFVKIRNLLMNRLFISNYDLNDDNMYEYYLKLERFQPSYVRGMASSLYVFSRYLINNNLKLNKGRPRLVHSACEQLFDWQKEMIEKAFVAPVANTYGLSELGDVAYEAPCGNMHIMDEDVYVELIPFQGDEQEIILTQLNNIMSPLIRYRTGDIAVSIDDSCSCKLNLRTLEGIKGRAHDFIISPDGKYIHGQFFTHLLVFEPGVVNYQIVQNLVSSLNIVLVVDQKFNKSSTETQLIKSIGDYMGNEMEVVFEYVESIPLTPSGKHRWVISKIMK